MTLKIRCARFGKKKNPCYSIMVADARSPRETGIEKIGIYQPCLPKDHPQRFMIQKDRMQYWVNCGAQATDRIKFLLKKADIVLQAVKGPSKTKAVQAEKISSQL